MKVLARVQVHTRSKEFRLAGRQVARDFANRVGEVTVEQARHNVSPGVGPGPHPHITPHKDTGRLRASIEKRMVEQGFLVVCEVFSTVPYGKDLELGWHTSTGRFVRYPWLAPAVAFAKARMAAIARSTFRVYFNASAFPVKGRVEIR